LLAIGCIPNLLPQSKSTCMHVLCLWHIKCHIKYFSEISKNKISKHETKSSYSPLYTSIIKNWKFQKENRDRWKSYKTRRGGNVNPQIPIFLIKQTAEMPRVKTKIGICGLHYHPSDPFLFHGFFSLIPTNPYSPSSLFLFCNPLMDYGQIVKVHISLTTN